MILFRIPLLLLAACTSCFAQVNFGYDVSDKIKDGKLDYTFIQDVSINDTGPDDPILSYRTEYDISGINQKDFSITTERFQGTIPRKEYIELMDGAKKLSMEGLKDIGDGSTSGQVTINGRSHHFSASPGTVERKRWKTFIDAILAKHAPASQRKKVTRSIQGDMVAPKSVTFAELFKDPAKYDGKRIRISGLYNGESMGSSSPPNANDLRNFDEALWLGQASSFTAPREIASAIGHTLTVEGTFEFRSGGNLGVLRAGIARVTEITGPEPRSTGQPASE